MAGQLRPGPIERFGHADTRQIEVIRAIIVTGTVGGAARLLNESSPGVSRAMKHAESLLGLMLFHRKGGRFDPTKLLIGAVPSISNVMTPRAIAGHSLDILGRSQPSSPRMASGKKLHKVNLGNALDI